MYIKTWTNPHWVTTSLITWKREDYEIDYFWLHAHVLCKQSKVYLYNTFHANGIAKQIVKHTQLKKRVQCKLKYTEGKNSEG